MADPGAGAAPARIEPLGEGALLVTLGPEVDLAVNARVHRLAAAMRDVRVPGADGLVVPLGHPVPGYASLLVPFDPLAVGEDAVRAAIEEALASTTPGSPTHPFVAVDASVLVTIQVRYGGTDGPDLSEVAQRAGLSEDEVIRRHAGTEYRVFCVGFVPGFSYLGVLPPELQLPRRATPRLRVPAGSVAIAGRQTGVYPAETPGGWHLIGRTDARAWDPARDRPALLEPGMRVRFEPA